MPTKCCRFDLTKGINHIRSQKWKIQNQKIYVFVLMSFDQKFRDIYELCVKTACIEVGAYCERVDEQIYEGSIITQIYNQITEADIIVADVSDKNLNVVYEIGYAHGKNKQVILLALKNEDIPFDLSHYPHIIYQGEKTYLKDQLKKRLKWLMRNLKRPLSNSLVPHQDGRATELL